MSDDRDDVYRYLLTQLTSERLKELSQKIIDAYKSGNHVKLRLYADSLFQDVEEKEPRLFIRLIKYFHPDRLNSLLQDVENSYARDDMQKLLFYKNLISADQYVTEAQALRFSVDDTEEYLYDRGDFGYHVSEDDVFEDDLHEVEEIFDILHAIKTRYLGNLDLSLDLLDLMTLEGNLDLSDFNLHDLEGLQYCRNITSLDLSNNRISDIANIQNLQYLEELFISCNSISNIEYLAALTHLAIADLSNNCIEDISPLLTLENLKFINLQKNPVSSKILIEELEEKTVVII
jgi:hypothetical protein